MAHPSPPDDRLAAARKAARSRDPAVRLAAVHDLLDLAVLPGADARPIVQLLDDLGRETYEPVLSATARAALAVVTRTVPPPRDDEPHALDVARLWGIRDPETFDPPARWGRRPVLTVPVGTGPDGAPLELDLREAADGGAGPHTLIVGATGSGKSELMRTIVLGLAAANPPDDVNVLLIDMYGSAAFFGLGDLPHVAGIPANFMGDYPDAVGRLIDVLHGELMRRQELFYAHGRVANIGEYRRSGRALPYLLVVVEEFDSLISMSPVVLDVLTAIGRVGRSLGVHLLLTSQRLHEGRLQGLDAAISCRIALRTYSATESRLVIGVPDAYQLPAEPGHGLLRTGAAPPVPFRAAYASATYRPGPPSWQHVLDEWRLDRRSLLDVLAARIAPHGERARQLWLAPLKAPITLADVYEEAPGGDPRVVPIGLVDVPLEHARRPLAVDLRGAAGNVAVVGQPDETRDALRTLLLSLALRRTAPARNRASREPTIVYCLVPDDDTLGPLTGLPNLAAVSRHDDAAAIVGRLAGGLADAHAAGLAGVAEDGPEGGWADWLGAPPAGALLVVADWTALHAAAGPGVAASLRDLLHEGPRHGVHVVATAQRWADLGDDAADTFRQRIELRLADPAGSAVSPRAAAGMSWGQPGRGLTADGLHLLVATPQLPPYDSAAELAAAIAGGQVASTAPGGPSIAAESE